jgi:hypothetical protein
MFATFTVFLEPLKFYAVTRLDVVDSRRRQQIIVEIRKIKLSSED